MTVHDILQCLILRELFVTELKKSCKCGVAVGGDDSSVEYPETPWTKEDQNTQIHQTTYKSSML